ncbi:MAG: 4a-hydroxytetrahydrobiopterin dehydratase [Desulfobacteraceae bacterium]|nr:4a-hydroxytetrahydrobiopterin dehydratase [Desulfobacteraceae bacterium]
MELLKERCEPKEKCLEPLPESEVKRLSEEVPEWKVRDGHLQREFKFAGFPEAMEFVNEVARMAREQDHHPDIYISYSKVVLTFFTHKANALTKNDFIMAAKINALK